MCSYCTTSKINNSTQCLQMTKYLRLRRFLPLQHQTDCQMLQIQQAGKEGGTVSSILCFTLKVERTPALHRMNKLVSKPTILKYTFNKLVKMNHLH